MRLTRGHRKGRRVREDLRWLPAVLVGRRMGEREGGLGETQVEADETADTTHGAVKGRREGRAGLGVAGFPQGTVVKEVELVVAAGRVGFAVGRNPDGAVEEFGCLAAGCWLGGCRIRSRRRCWLHGDWDVDAYIDVEIVLLGSCLEAFDKGGLALRLGEGQRFFR